jgi:Putative MetA-pathway of phenol degradation
MKDALRGFLRCAATLVLLCGALGTASAGPPYLTDDPEPTDYLHWEIYLSYNSFFNSSGAFSSAPLLELNYGAAPNVQVSVTPQFAYGQPNGGTSAYGVGDTLFGVKYRFLQETKSRPQVAFYPEFSAPTGDQIRGLGNGKPQYYLPLWAQKSWGKLTTYGGGGYWVNPAAGQRNYMFTGWLAQYSVTKRLALGGEIFYQGSTAVNVGSQTGFNLGAIYDLNEIHHLVFSAGTDFHGPNHGMVYAGYLWTFGPKEKKEEAHAAEPEKK